MKSSPPLTLEQLQQAFAEWRRTRQPRAVPTELRRNALALAQEYGPAVVLRTLELSDSVLARWKQKHPTTSQAPQGFVPLPVVTERHSEVVPAANSALRLTIRREAQGLALSGEMSLSQWREALSLLEVE